MGACLCHKPTSQQSPRQSIDASGKNEEVKEQQEIDKPPSAAPVKSQVSNPQPALESVKPVPAKELAEVDEQSTVESAFRRFAGNDDTLSDDSKIADFFLLLGCPLDKAEGFAAFYLLSAEQFSEIQLQEILKYCTQCASGRNSVTLFKDLKRLLGTKIPQVYATARSLHALFEYIFLTSKKSDTMYKTLGRDIAVPVLKSNCDTVLAQGIPSFRASPIVQQFSVFIEGSAHAGFTKDEWCNMV